MRSSPEITPALMELASPNGLPMAYASLPSRTALRIAEDRRHDLGRWLGRAQDRDIDRRISRAMISPGERVPSAKVRPMD